MAAFRNDLVLSMNEKSKHAHQKTIDEAELVSFDVFDTLIHRIAFRPVNVFDLLARRLHSTEIALHHPGLIAGFPQLREAYEKAAREQYFKALGTYEITLRDIYALLQEKLAIDPVIMEQIMREELLMELALVYPNPWMQSLYDYAVAQDKKVILCSDMYLSTETIGRLLEKCGFQPPFTLFVSGELKKSKHEGSMYHWACEKFGVSPSAMAHFGDNEHADFRVPTDLGVKAHHFDTVLRNIEPQLRLPTPAESPDRAVIHLIQGAIRNILVNAEPDHDFWFDMGVQIFGPLFLGNFLWLMSQLRREPVDKVLFFARDAIFAHELFQRYGAQLGVETPSEYVYFSRSALLVPSFTEMNMHRVWHLFSGRSTRTVQQHLIRLDIDPTLVRAEILDSGFSSANDMVPNRDVRMFNLLNRLYPLILETAKRRREIVAEYVRQVAESNRRIAIVDIGWTGNMQGSFCRLLQLSRSDFELIGLYYGTFKGVTANYLPRNGYRCYLVREEQPPELFKPLVNGGVELMEFAHMASHGTTLGYERVDGKIQPILENNPDDKEMQALASRVQQGAMRFVEAVMPAVLSVGAENLVSVAWSDPFYRLVNQPSLEEAQYLGALTHSDTASDTANRLPLAEKLDPAVARRRGAEYKKAYERAFWKKAFKMING